MYRQLQTRKKSESRDLRYQLLYVNNHQPINFRYFAFAPSNRKYVEWYLDKIPRLYLYYFIEIQSVTVLKLSRNYKLRVTSTTGSVHRYMLDIFT